MLKECWSLILVTSHVEPLPLTRWYLGPWLPSWHIDQRCPKNQQQCISMSPPPLTHPLTCCHQTTTTTNDHHQHIYATTCISRCPTTPKWCQWPPGTTNNKWWTGTQDDLCLESPGMFYYYYYYFYLLLCLLCLFTTRLHVCSAIQRKTQKRAHRCVNTHTNTIYASTCVLRCHTTPKWSFNDVANRQQTTNSEQGFETICVSSPQVCFFNLNYYFFKIY